MDVAYDHIQEENFPDEQDEGTPKPSSEQQQRQGQGQGQTPAQPQPSLNEDLQEAYKAISTSTWGVKIGGFLGNVVKQGESVYRDAQQEFNVVSGEAQHRFTDLRDAVINRTRSLSLTTGQQQQPPAEGAAAADRSLDGKDDEDKATTPTNNSGLSAEETGRKAESVLARIQAEAAKRLKDLQQAEDAADEALLKFGTNVRDFLQNAITIAPPADGVDSAQTGGNQVLFESKDSQGKRVIHTSRFDAQLHVIHSSPDGFARDPESDGFAAWAGDFDAEKKTDDISGDLAKYPELRATMEKLVPDKIPYADFWRRYYFLRHSVETAEAKRRDLLKAVSADDEVGWGDEDSDDEAGSGIPGEKRPASTGSSTTIHPPATSTPTATHLKVGESRKSDEKSQPDSEASYDVVGATSGNPSQAPSSPKDSRRAEDSDDDWE